VSLVAMAALPAALPTAHAAHCHGPTHCACLIPPSFSTVPSIVRAIYRHYTEQVSEAVTLLSHIQEVFGSNLG
jgi:hypothetical protein